MQRIGVDQGNLQALLALAQQQQQAPQNNSNTSNIMSNNSSNNTEKNNSQETFANANKSNSSPIKFNDNIAINASNLETQKENDNNHAISNSNSSQCDSSVISNVDGANLQLQSMSISNQATPDTMQQENHQNVSNPMQMEQAYCNNSIVAPQGNLSGAPSVSSNVAFGAFNGLNTYPTPMQVGFGYNYSYNQNYPMYGSYNNQILANQSHINSNYNSIANASNNNTNNNINSNLNVISQQSNVSNSNQSNGNNCNQPKDSKTGFFVLKNIEENLKKLDWSMFMILRCFCVIFVNIYNIFLVFL